MRKILKIEILRAYNNKWFWISTLFGFLAATREVSTRSLEGKRYNDVLSPHSFYPFSIYGERMFTFDDLSDTFIPMILIMPILATLPYSTSWLADRGGYASHLMSRESHANYIRAKEVACFLTGGTVLIIPQFSGLLGASFFLPFLTPYPNTGTNRVLSNTWMADFYFDHPLAYLLIQYLMLFAWGGTFALMGMLVGRLTRITMLALGLPLILLFCFDVIMSFISHGSFYGQQISPLSIYLPTPTVLGVTGAQLIGTWLVLTMVLLITIEYFARRDELL